MGSRRTPCPPQLRERFRVERRLGEGGMGAVFLGTQPGLDRKVALKVLKVSDPDPEAILRFENEARALAAVEHPNMVRVHDFGQEGDTVYLVMEYVHGTSLAYMLHKKKRLSVHDARTILFCVGEALEAIHDAGMLHRDVKPDNVMIDDSGRPVLMDLGLARLDIAPDEDTLHGKAIGTLLYMAPEVARSKGGDRAADWYAWGAALYECLDGDAPLDKATVIGAIRQKGAWPLPPKPACPPEGDDLAALASWCLRESPAKRPASFAEIKEVMTGERKAPVACWSTIEPRPDSARRSVQRRKRRKRGKSRMTPRAVAGISAALVGAAGAWFVMRAAPGPAAGIAVDSVRVVGLGDGRAAARLPRDHGPGVVLRIRPRGRGDDLVLPLGTAATAPFDATEPSRIRVETADGASAWRDLPRAPLQVPRPADYELVPGGLLLFGTGAPPDRSYRLRSDGLPATPVTEVTTSAQLWTARVSLPASPPGRRPYLSRDEAGALPVEVPLRWDPLPNDTSTLEELRTFLEGHTSFVTEGGRSPALLDARERWLKVRSHVLGSWPQLDAGTRALFVEVLTRLIREEDGQARWTRATAFVRDLQLLDPRGAEDVLRRVAAAGIPREPLEDPRVLTVPEGLAALCQLAGGLERGGEAPPLATRGRDQASTARRGAFLPSPYGGARAERWIAWALWGHWAGQAVAVPGRARDAMFGYLSRTLQDRRRGPRDTRLMPFLPYGAGRSAPHPARVTHEIHAAWNRLEGSSLPRKQLLAPVLLEGLLPARPGTASPDLLEGLLAQVERLAEPHVGRVLQARLRLFEPALARLEPHVAISTAALRQRLADLRAWLRGEAELR